ncbi:MAG: DUF21 domain-containing protein [Zetaproteobacteria bacterium]|nr:MAG: DUF21 domain-containing protein [Zetaproteobacteria bacterium]
MNISNLSLSIIGGILLLLLLLSAFFSGSETALTRAHKARLRTRQKEGDKGAGLALKLIEAPENMLSTILLGNNFVNIAASSLATALFLSLFGEAGIAYATIAMTIIVLVFAEVLPKTIAVANAEHFACRVARPMRAIQWLLTPLVWLLMHMIDLLKRLLRLPEKDETPLTHKELATLIDISAESGMLDRAREQMLNSSLHLHEVPVKALMVPRKSMQTIDGAQSIEQVIKGIMQQPYSRYPVYLGETDHLIGIVHLRDLIKLPDKKQRLADALVWQEPSYIPSTKNALAQLFDFQSQHQHMAIVVDEFGDIEGLITLEDIIEEIVGEIHDESDRPRYADMWPQPDGSLIAAATANLHDINQTMDWELPEDRANTIGGLIVATLGLQPEEKLCLVIARVRIEILSLRDDWIQRVRLSAEPDKVEP